MRPIQQFPSAVPTFKPNNSSIVRQNSQPNQGQEPTILDLFKQQMLRAWQPVPTLTKTIILFFIMSLIFLGIGIPMLILSTNIVEFTVRYDNICPSNATVCLLNITIPTTIPGPVFVYYQLHNFYQNHRLYAKSLSAKQLRGDNVSVSDIASDCDPIVYNRDLYVNLSINNVSLSPNQTANPCGIIAYTLFNDSFVIPSVTISEDNIAWPSDPEKYKMVNQSVMWTNITSPRFMNWMRIAALPNFRKLWGRIQNGLNSGNYTLNITNNYNISSFNGQKYFVVSSSNFFGSKNQFLSIAYIIVGGLCLIIAILFLTKKLLKKEKFHDMYQLQKQFIKYHFK